MYYKFDCGCVYQLEPLIKPTKDDAKYRWVMITPCKEDVEIWRGRIDCFTTRGLEYYNCKPINKFDTAILKLSRG